MSFRPWTFAALLPVGLAVWGTGQGSSRYRIALKTEQVVDLSGLGQKEQRQSSELTAFFNVTLTDSAGGSVMQVVIDSLQADTALSIPAALQDSARGASWHALVTPGGRISGLARVRSTPLSGVFEGLLRRFLPPVARGRRAGEAWTDTLDATDDIPDGLLNIRTVTNYLAATETFAGAKALRVVAASSSAMTGQQQTTGGQTNIEGTGTTNTTYYLGPDGRYLGGSSTQVQNLKVSGSFAPQPVPITITSEVMVTVLR